MCGIAGFIDTSSGGDSGPVLERMTAALRHRGLDDSGLYADRDAALGHRRLSIIDLSGGHQPMSNEDGSLWIVYNGEIFNHADLRPGLERAGHRYKTRSDTEMILHAYEEYGPACLGHFRGMFAFAIWDRNSRQLFCARDRLGIKPFYYFWNGRLFAFASEIKALFEHPAISPALEETLLPEHLAFGYSCGDTTLFSGIRKLMPGHHVTLAFERGGRARLDVRRYWDIPPAAEAAEEQRDDESWIRECRTRLEETVRMRLMSDVPLGTFLSGGVDSSAITALVKQMSGGRVETFSVGYAEAAYSELAWARDAASHLGTDHHEVVVGMRDFFDALPRLVWHEDEPIAWPSSVSLYFVSRLAAERVKVVLTGEGSDELFAGYARYRHYLRSHEWARRYSVLPHSIRAWMHGWIARSRLLWSTPRRKLQHTFIGRDDSVESLYIDNFYSGFSQAERDSMFTSVPPSPAYGGFMSFWNFGRPGTLLDRMLYADQKTYLVELLMKQDQMSMACSIESRVPLLDHHFVEFAARVPAHLKIRGREQKYIFKKAVADLLPDRITYRRKMGFPTPVRDWLRAPEAKPLLDLLRSRDGLIRGYVDPPRLDALIARHMSGTEDCTDRLWRLLNLQIWGELFITGRRDRVRDGSLFRTAADNLP